MEKSVITSTFIRIRGKLRGMATAIVGSREDADDVLHDAFCKLWMNHREVKNELSAIRLSYTVVRNTAIDSFRQRRNHNNVDLDSNDITDASVSEKEAEESREICEAVLNLSKRILKPLHYEIFILHDVENLKYSEIAERFGISETNVRQILSRSRKQIRDAYRNTHL